MIVKMKVPKPVGPLITYCIEIRPGGPVKIGKTRQLEQRLGAGAAFNDQLKVLATFPCSGETSEMALHERFGLWRLGGELFEGDVIREWLETVKS